MIQRVPIVPSIANYRFGTTLEGIEYVIDIRWNGRDAAWYMDLMDVSAVMIRAGMKLVLGTPIGVRVADAEFPQGLFFVMDQAGTGVDASYNDMGSRIVLEYGPWEDLGLTGRS